MNKEEEEEEEEKRERGWEKCREEIITTQK